MNIPVDKTITSQVDLTQAKSYLLVYLCHELNRTELFHNHTVHTPFILDNFIFIFKHSDYSMTYINNILHILTTFMKSIHVTHTHHTNISYESIIKVLNVYTTLLKNKQTNKLIVTSPLFTNNFDSLMLYIHNYIVIHSTYSNDILDHLCDIFDDLNLIFIKNYLFHKIRIYESLELNSVTLDDNITNDYKILIMCSYILSFYVLKHNITYIYNDTLILQINAQLPQMSMYDKDLSSSIQLSITNDDNNDNNDNDNNDDNYIPLEKDKNRILIFKYLLKIYTISIIPLFYKLEQLANDITITTRSINEMNINNDINTYRNCIIKALTNQKKEHEYKYNAFFSSIYNEQFIMMIVSILNGLYKHILTQDINIEQYLIEFTIMFLKKICNKNIIKRNYKQFTYIIIGLLHIIDTNKTEINIYLKCLIIELITFNKGVIIQLLQECNESTYYITLLLHSIVSIYTYIEIHNTFDQEEKLLLRNNILIIINHLLLYNNITKDILNKVDINSLLFLFLQDINYYFEYIIQYINTRRSIITNTYKIRLSNYTLFIKQSFSFLSILLQYDKDIIHTDYISHNIISNLNTYINTILDPRANHYFFNFNNGNIFFSWKNDILQKIHRIFDMYKDDHKFCLLLLSEGSNYKSNYVKQLESFLNTDLLQSDTQETNMDILIHNVNKLSELSNNTIDNNLIPEKFLDPILMTVIKEPVLLPDSNTFVDKYMIYNHLLINKTDPFTQLYLDKDILYTFNIREDNIIKIQTFKDEYTTFVNEFNKDVLINNSINNSINNDTNNMNDMNISNVNEGINSTLINDNTQNEYTLNNVESSKENNEENSKENNDESSKENNDESSKENNEESSK